MKKPVVKFARGDAPLPRKMLDGLIGLRAPMTFVVPAGKSMKVHFDLRCDKTLMLLPGRVSPDQDDFLKHAGNLISVNVKNNSPEDQFFDVGDTVITATALGMVDYEVE